MNCVLNSWASHESELLGYLMHQVGDKYLAEDLLQDVFFKAIAKGSGFCELKNPRAWLFKVTRNRLTDYYRKRKKQVVLGDVSVKSDKIDALVALSSCLPRALHDLSEDDREVITRCDLEGMSQTDYAKLKQLSLPAIKSRIQRARKRLKVQLHTNCQVRFDECGKVCCFVPRPIRQE